jgi:heme exporter protein C
VTAPRTRTPESAAGDAPRGRPVDSTASTGTRVLGALSLLGVGALLLFGLVLSPDDRVQGDAVRLMYVHVPPAILMYVAFLVTAVASIGYLWKRSVFCDLVAAASAEIGTVFTAMTLATGMLWGRITWGVFWVWDARLTSTALLLLLFLGYLAVRRIPADPAVRSKRAAIVALIAFVDVPIVHYSVDWWRSVHQPATISRLDPTIEGLMLFTLMLGIVVFGLIYAWLTVHRFRLEYLREQVAERGLSHALEARRAEARPTAAPTSVATAGGAE